MTQPEKEKVERQLQDCDIQIVHNLGSLCVLNYTYDKLTGSAKLTSLNVDDMTKYLDKDRVVDGLLDQLCDAIVTVLYNEVNLRNANEEFKIKGKEWEKYAIALLPEEEIISTRFRNAAIDYLTNEIPEEKIEKLKEICEYNEMDPDNWLDYFLSDYIEVVMSDFDNFGEEGSLTPEEYIDDQISIYEDDRRIETENN